MGKINWTKVIITVVKYLVAVLAGALGGETLSSCVNAL